MRRVTAIRATAFGDLGTDDPTASLSWLTDRTRAVIGPAIEQARADRAAEVGTEHLPHGILAEGTNLAVRVLRALEIDPVRALVGYTHVRADTAASADTQAVIAAAVRAELRPIVDRIGRLERHAGVVEGD